MTSLLLALALMVDHSLIHRLAAQLPTFTGKERVIVLGEPDCGKSTIAEALASRREKALFFDVGGDDYTKPGRLVLSAAELARFPGFLNDPHARIVVVPRGDTPSDVHEELRLVLLTLGLWEKPAPRRELIFIADETGDHRSASEHTLNKLFRWGRHLHMTMVLVSQVATDIPKTCRRVASHVISLGQSHHSDLEALEKDYGAEFVARVAAWRKYDPPVLWSRAAQLERRGEAEPFPNPSEEESS